MSPRRLLVTGGAGFIGSNFIRYILENHPADTLVTLDKLTYAGNPENLRELEGNARHRFVQGDIADPAVVRPLIGQADFIVNFAAETHVDRSIVDSAAFLTTNIIGTQVLLDQIRQAARKPRLFLQISTDEVYGSIPVGAATEQSPLRANSPYAASKAGADLLVGAYHATFGLPVAITRSSNNYGPYQYPEKFIPLAITQALHDEPIPLYGDGLNVRDWIYVEDNCRAIDAVLQTARPDAAELEIYNIGGDQERTNRQVLETLLRILGKPASLIQPVKDRPGHDRRYALSSEKLQRTSKERNWAWPPRHPFEEGLKKTIAWYQGHTDWWKPLLKEKGRAAVHWLSTKKGE
ncbi:MAG: dTDP-glucose 4,6-dehydratase [Candidatus Omnitrophica bacterium]|nr:dTDP-glucose 4,6-dehydratase [Candidatus Omnitrophota bacterium]